MTGRTGKEPHAIADKGCHRYSRQDTDMLVREASTVEIQEKDGILKISRLRHEFLSQMENCHSSRIASKKERKHYHFS